MTTPATDTSKHKRIRASESAIVAAINAAKRSGLCVDSMLIEGGKVEIKFGGIVANDDTPDDGGLEKW